MDPTWLAQARAAGLERAIEQFPDDVEAAAAEAFRRRGQIPAETDAAAEPWPPMRPGTTL